MAIRGPLRGAVGAWSAAAATALGALLAAAGGQQAPAAAPRLELRPGLAIPWAGAKVTYTAALSGAAPGSRWAVSLTRASPRGDVLLGRSRIRAAADGTAETAATADFAAAGWFTVTAKATPAGGQALTASLRTPVTARRVDIAWYQGEKGHELHNVTMQLTADGEEATYWRRRGVLAARWCGAACGADKPLDHFVKAWSSHESIAIDEFGGPPEACEKFHQALLPARKLNPAGFIAVWFCGGYDHWARLRDAVDLFLPEVYLNYGAYDLGRFDWFIRHGRESGVFGKMLIGLGINVVTDKDGHVQHRPTPEEVVGEIRSLKQTAPDLRGIALFAYGSAEPAVRAAVDKAAEDYFIRPVADLAEARVEPESASPSAPAMATFTVRNAGGMPARGLQVWLRDGAFRKLAWKGDLDAGGERRGRVTWQPQPGWREVKLELAAPAGVTVLRGSATGVVARPQQQGPIALVPAALASSSLGPVFLPVDAEAKSASAVELDPGGKPAAMPAPVQVLDGPDGCRAVWLDGRPWPYGKLWQLSETPPPGGMPGPLPREGAVFKTPGPGAAFVLDTSQDALTAASYNGHEILASPWKMNWDAWRGFGEPTVEYGPYAYVVTVPVRNELIEGYSRYAFFASFVEITRWFRALGDEVSVESAGEMASLPQRPGSYALMFGLGTPLSRGRLQVGADYRDLYFGQTSLDPTYCDRGGWLDFSWDGAEGVGLGVAIGRKWEHQASRADYDVTRLYDAADWLEVAEVWGRPTKLRSEWSRVYLVPHAPVDLERQGALSPAQALYGAIHSPARLLK